jgi:hypothetical protein
MENARWGADPVYGLEGQAVDRRVPNARSNRSCHPSILIRAVHGRDILRLDLVPKSVRPRGFTPRPRRSARRSGQPTVRSWQRFGRRPRSSRRADRDQEPPEGVRCISIASPPPFQRPGRVPRPASSVVRQGKKPLRPLRTSHLRLFAFNSSGFFHTFSSQLVHFDLWGEEYGGKTVSVAAHREQEHRVARPPPRMPEQRSLFAEKVRTGPGY